ncbi:MAG: prepilin-type N-terminal cleavage/methylation domain-containing protein [Candidatus Omnitrophica bacterium]|nr:prepilin-type N-terminal cleavage/methylation domain-containing protein [Candidatus Omnitrophota bacterium]
MLKRKSQYKRLNFLSGIQANSGFSLIELLIVISIIGILTLLGIPLFRDFIQFSSLKSDAWKLVSDLRSYRQLAIIEHNNYSFVFDLNSDSYIIEQRNSGTNALIATVATRTLSNDITQAVDTTFMPKGQANIAAQINIKGKNSADQVIINVFATTGLSKMTGP